MTASAILAVDGLVAGYEPGVPIVRGVSVDVKEGEIVILLGPNGAGKSTLVRAIAGLVPVFAGSVRLAGHDITGVPAHRIVHQGMAFVPQTENVFTALTIEENLQLAGHILPASARARQTEAMYGLFPDLGRQRRMAAGRLSGGQRQMLAIARALMIQPKLLMLDEVSAGLSPKLVEAVFAKLVEIRRSGATILLVEQNARAALAVGDRAYVLAEGQNRHEGAAMALGNDPVVARLYLGGMAAARGRSANP
jgi:branched-chain amino acid transport system ATP-binding protein